MTINIKSAEDIEAMRHACRLASEVLDYRPTSSPASPPARIDRLGAGAWPSRAPSPPPWATSPRLPALPCVAVHVGQPRGVPRHSQRQAPEKGDIVNVDVTVITKDGWYGDNSRMYLIGECSIAAKRLSAVTF